MPRRKIADPEAIKAAAAELPDLTPKQQEFVRLLLAGRTGADAYRGSHDTSTMSANSIACEASKLRINPQIAQWLSAGRQAHLGTAVLTREAHLAELERLKELALEAGNHGAAMQAEMARGKVAGHHIDRVMEVPADVTDTLKTIAEHQPDLAAALAQAHGIEWAADERATKH